MQTLVHEDENNPLEWNDHELLNSEYHAEKWIYGMYSW
jgi:hypothetical protein